MTMGKMKVIPKSEMTQAEIYSLEQRIQESLIKMALQADLASDRSELVIRDILPFTDLAGALGNEHWTNQIICVANGWQAAPDFNIRLAGIQANRVMAFYKVFNRSVNPTISLARFQLAQTGVLAVLQLEELWAEQEQVGFFGPIFYNDNETVRIDYYANAATAAGGEQIGLPAMVCEPYGEVISQDAKKRVLAAKWQ